MARINRVDPNDKRKEQEQVRVLNAGNQPDELDISQIAADDGTYRDPAVDLGSIEQDAARGPQVKKFRVINGGRCATQRNGQRSFVMAGKVCDELNFDIKLMREQGIQFAEVTDSEVES